MSHYSLIAKILVFAILMIKDILRKLLYAYFHHADVAELADALDLGSSGRPCRFDSCMPHHFFKARVVKLVDAMDSKSIDESHIGSSPIAGTIKEESALIQYKFCFKAFLYQNIGVEVPELIVE